jgi:hypothetical protein
MVTDPIAIDALLGRQDVPGKTWRLLAGRIDQSALFLEKPDGIGARQDTSCCAP